MLTMTKESEAFLNALVPAEGSVATDHTDAIYALLEPLHDVLDRMDAHLQAIDKLRRAADRVEENPKVYGWFERFKQNIDAGRLKAANAKRALEDISDLCFSLDSYAIEMRTEMARQPQETKSKYRVNLTTVEHEHLKASVAEANARLADALKELDALKAAP